MALVQTYTAPMQLLAHDAVEPVDDTIVFLRSPKLTREVLGTTYVPKQINIAMGLSNELAIQHILEAFYGKTLYKDPYIMAKCDFYDTEDKALATIGVEVKGRVDQAHDAWATGFVDVHKVQAHIKGKKYYYVFIYKDGIYYTPYFKKRFDTYTINTEETAYRPESGRRECSPRYEVPHTDMRLLCSFND